MALVRSEWLTPQARPRQALDGLLRRPDAAKLVRATPAQPLFLFIKSLGLEDAIELLGLCSTEQVQAFLDMDAWEGDRISPSRFLPWLAALGELGIQKLAAHVRRLDPELLTSFLAPRLRIYELAEEEPPETSEGLLYATPDRFYVIDILPDADGDGAEQALLQRFLDDIYRADLELGRTIVQSARWDGGAETEELAYRFRSGRMADLGYIDPYEALKIYMLLDPLSQTARPTLELPAPPPGEAGPAALIFLPALPGFDDVDSTFGRAAAHLAEPERERLFQHLLHLANRAMSADRVELGDADAARDVLQRTAGYLSLGLEFHLLPPAARADTTRAPEVQVNVAQAAQLLRESLADKAPVDLLRLFRIGHSLTMQLRKLALLLGKDPNASLLTLVPDEDPASLLPPRLGEPLRGLLLLRPLYSGYLDPGKPSAGPLEAVPAMRPFRSLADLGRAAQFLSDLATLGMFLTAGLGLRRETLAGSLGGTVPGVREVRLDDLLGTMVANLLLERPPVFVPIARRDLPALRRRALGNQAEAKALPPAALARIRTALLARVKERSPDQREAAALWSAASQRLLDETLETLGQSLGTLPPDLPPDLADAVTRLGGLVLG